GGHLLRPLARPPRLVARTDRGPALRVAPAHRQAWNVPDPGRHHAAAPGRSVCKRHGAGREEPLAARTPPGDARDARDSHPLVKRRTCSPPAFRRAPEPACLLLWIAPTSRQSEGAEAPCSVESRHANELESDHGAAPREFAS